MFMGNPAGVIDILIFTSLPLVAPGVIYGKLLRSYELAITTLRKLNDIARKGQKTGISSLILPTAGSVRNHKTKFKQSHNIIIINNYICNTLIT